MDMTFDEFSQAMDMESYYRDLTMKFGVGGSITLLGAFVLLEVSYNARKLSIHGNATEVPEVTKIEDFASRVEDGNGTVTYSTIPIVVKFRCRACNAINEEGHKFCQNCGTPL